MVGARCTVPLRINQPTLSILFFIFDAATGLTWQQSGSGIRIYLLAEDYLKEINAETYGGYSDWRLPTLEEAMSLMEPEKNGSMFIDPIFDKKQQYIWTSAKFTDSVAWAVDFRFGGCYDGRVVNDVYVRAVR